MTVISRPQSPAGSVVIAASNTPARLKRFADYICDGTDDQDQINAASAALGDVGGKIELLPGTYSAEGIYLRERVHFVGDCYSTTINLKAGGSDSLFVLEEEIDNFRGGSIRGIAMYGDGILTGRNCIDWTGVTTSLLRFNVVDCHIEAFYKGWMGSTAERQPEIRNTIFHNCGVAIHASEHPIIDMCDIRSCIIGIADIFDAHVSDTKIIQNELGVSDVTAEATAASTTTSTITSSTDVFSACLYSFVVFLETRGAYQITAINSVTNVTVDGDPSAETGKFIVTGNGVSSNTFTGVSAATNTLAEFVLHSQNHLSNCRLLTSTVTNGQRGIYIRGANNQINVKVEHQTATFGYSVGTISLAAIGASSIVTDNLITGSTLTNGAAAPIIALEGNAWCDRVMLIGNRIWLSYGPILKATSGFTRGWSIAGNHILLRGVLTDPLVTVFDVGTTASNAFTGNHITRHNTGNSCPSILEGEWLKAAITGNHVSNFAAVAPLVSATAVTTGALIDANNET